MPASRISHRQARNRHGHHATYGSMGTWHFTAADLFCGCDSPYPAGAAPASACWPGSDRTEPLGVHWSNRRHIPALGRDVGERDDPGRPEAGIGA